MLKISKMSQVAISALSLLAEYYKNGRAANSQIIAEVRNYPKPVVAKVLTVLSQEGLVNGTPGPGGGYVLAKKPDAIRLFDVVKIFDNPDDALACPFGPGWCGNNDPCPIHDSLEEMDLKFREFLHETRFEVFTTGNEIPESAPSLK